MIIIIVIILDGRAETSCFLVLVRISACVIESNPGCVSYPAAFTADNEECFLTTNVDAVPDLRVCGYVPPLHNDIWRLGD
jgi:hypothetical protein